MPLCASTPDVGLSGDAASLLALLDSLEEQIVVIDKAGTIHFTNLAWNRFAEENGMPAGHNWLGSNYLKVCDGAGEAHSKEAAEGIRRIMSGRQERFYLEYPCHSPTTQRWFMMRACAVSGREQALFIIAHINITERKLLELKVASLSMHDPLTGLANRRLFDNFLHNEWRRSQREHMPLTLMLLDLDNFKACNDCYGHLAGDAYLQLVSKVLKSFCKRPTDLACRFGGDEFALVLGNTGIDSARRMAGEICLAIADLGIAADDCHRVTASLGVASCSPDTTGMSETDLCAVADSALYQAKDGGKNGCYCLVC
ncbi:GGDEF domain-containing protein [Shewanella sp. JM162201]|uniref:diguanylate cyclase n=1 Tax=Shewanella jiangmenensis TaxID=2837387 RepID=A0ABS5V3S4_9GAMM|nr:GGDEF domain-containing protein [Shewanella jiangmenensis]MBT1445104.1 GGDEF domain-containing protein [Shewanella jiangmenensis]